MEDNTTIFDRPVQLVKHDLETFKVTDAGRRVLEDLGPVPLKVVTFLGAYRTGKSYLLSRLMGHTAGFEVGTSVMGQTQGLWAWGAKRDKSGCVTLFVDSEGLYDLDGTTKDEVTDTKLATIATLMSSFLFLNIVNVVGRDTFQNLAAVTRAAEKMDFGDGLSGEEKLERMRRMFPILWFVLRDHSLEWSVPRAAYEAKYGKLSSKDMKKLAKLSQSKDDELKNVVCTPEEYLEWALSDKGTDTDQVCRTLRTAFPTAKRGIIGLPRPVDDEEVLLDMSKVKVGDVKKDFNRGVDALRKMIAKDAHAKGFISSLVRGGPTPGEDGGAPDITEMTGDGLAAFLDVLIEKINKGDSAIDVPSVLESYDSQIVSRYQDKALTGYRKTMEAVPLPCDTSALDKAHASAVKEAREVVQSCGVIGRSMTRAVEKLYARLHGTNDPELPDSAGSAIAREYYDKNMRASRDQCTAVLAEVSRGIEAELERFKKVGNFNDAVAKGKKTLAKQCVGPAKDEVLETLEEREGRWHGEVMMRLKLEEEKRRIEEEKRRQREERERQERERKRREEEAREAERRRRAAEEERKRAQEEKERREREAAQRQSYSYSSYGYHDPFMYGYGAPIMFGYPTCSIQ